MNNKNSNSESYIVREAENIIEKYLNDREMSDINKYYILKEKYKKLKVLTGAMFIIMLTAVCFSVILK